MSPLIVPFRNLHQMRDVYAVSPGGDAAPLEVHIATRADGLPGAGTLLDPYNGTLDFDKCFRRLTVAPYLEESGYPRPMRVYIHQGDYAGDGWWWYWIDSPTAWTGVPFYPDIETARGFWLLPNMEVIGIGDVTYTVTDWPKFANGVIWPYAHHAWGTCNGAWSLGGDNTKVRNIKINCNANGLLDRPSNAKMHGILLHGDNTEITDCKYENAAGFNFANKPIVGFTVASPSIVEVTAHGFKTGDLVSLGGVKMAAGGAGTEDDADHSELNNIQAPIDVIDADHFYLREFNSSPNRRAVTIPVSVPGTAYFGGNEAFVFSCNKVSGPGIAGFPNIAKATNNSKIQRCEGLSFVGNYGVSFAIFAGSAGKNGEISDNRSYDQVMTCMAQVMGVNHKIIRNFTRGVTALVHLDTGYIKGLVIEGNTCLDSERTCISFTPAFIEPDEAELVSEQTEITIRNNYLQNSYSGDQVASVILLNKNSNILSNIVIDGNTLEFIGASPNPFNVVSYACDGLNIKNNVSSANVACLIYPETIGISLANNKTAMGLVPGLMDDTKMSASLYLSANFVTGLANVLQKIPFNVIAYNYSRIGAFVDTADSKFVIQVAGFYKVGVSVFTSEVSWTWAVYVNAVATITLCQGRLMGGTLGFSGASSDPMYFNAGDELEFYAYSNVGAQVVYGEAAALPTSSCWIEAVNR